MKSPKITVSACPERKAALARLLRAWKVKIRRALEPNSRFDFWHLLDAEEDTLIRHIQEHWQPGMTWKNYGDWQMEAVDRREVGCLDDLYQKFRYDNFRPVWRVPREEPRVRSRQREVVS